MARSALRALGVRRLSLLAVPDWHGQERLAAGSAFVRTLSEWAAEGDEIVLHGWSHTCAGLKEKKRDLFWTRFYTANEAEFRIASREEARSRLLAGRDLFDQFDWKPVGFIAPAWFGGPSFTAGGGGGGGSSSAGCCSITKLIVVSTVIAPGLPSISAGSNTYCIAAATAASSNPSPT